MTWDPESWAITPAQLSMRISRPGGNWICNEGCSTQAAQMGGWVWEELSLEPQTQGPGHQLWRAAANCPGSPVNKVGKPWGGSPLPAKIKYKICREITRRAVMISLRDSGINYNINRMPPPPRSFYNLCRTSEVSQLGGHHTTSVWQIRARALSPEWSPQLFGTAQWAWRWFSDSGEA